MATNPPAPRTERTRTATAGMPASGDRTRGAAAGPSDDELDQRNRMKSGPRRPAGPPLAGDTPEPVPTRSLPERDLPPPTDPEPR